MPRQQSTRAPPKHFARLTAALARAAIDVAATDAPVVLDVGAGTGHAGARPSPGARCAASHWRRPAQGAKLKASFELADVQPVGWDLRLTRPEAEALVCMGPAARHLTPAVERRLRALPATVAVTAAVDLHVFRRQLDARSSRSASSTIRPSGPRT
jgi:hypothetical protein